MVRELCLVAVLASLVGTTQAQVARSRKNTDLIRVDRPGIEAQTSVPIVIKFAGTLRPFQAQPGSAPIGITFALYKEEYGGAALWLETQNVVVDSKGRFTVFLGSASREGVPRDVFASGEARWLEMTASDGIERARVMLSSVPYAFKAADAQTLGGRNPGEFVTQEQLASFIAHSVRPGPRWPIRPTDPAPGGPAVASTFQSTIGTGPSFVSNATDGPPLQVNSNVLVQNLNVDLLHGFSDRDFAKINFENQFTTNQQFRAGTLHPPVPGDGSTAESSTSEDFEARGRSTFNPELVSQKFRWQVDGSDLNVPQPRFSLSFGSGGQTPQPTGFSLNADGTINFAPGQTFPANSIMSAIGPLLGVAGNNGSGSGSLSTAPSGNQNVTQPPGTSMNVDNLNNTRTVQASDNWAAGPIAIALTAGVEATVTLAPCPRGIDTSGSPTLGGPKGGYAIRIYDAVLPNTQSESVYVTGGTCAAGSPSGTVVFTPFFSHLASSYRIGSASSGIQEAINEVCGINTIAYRNSSCHVVIPPTGQQSNGYLGYEIYDTIYFHANSSVLSGYGAILNCRERGPCLQVGNLNNANDYNGNTIEGISFRTIDNRRSDPAFSGSLIQSTQRVGGTITIQTAAPHNLRSGDRVTQLLTDSSNYWGDVPSITVTDPTHYTYTRANTADIPLQLTPGIVALSYEAVLDNANSTRLVDLQYEKTYEYGAFNNFFDFWDDENSQVEKFTNNAIGLNQSANWTGSFVWSGGAMNLPNRSQQLAPVITIKNSNFTANGSNCATVYNSNGFYVENSVCQAQGPWEFLVSTINGNYQGADFQNIYSEAALSVNPTTPARSPWPGLGVAGFIGGPTAGGYTLRGQGGFSGLLPTVGNGASTYIYYVVARDLTTGTQTSPLPLMYEKEDSPGAVTVQWPRLAAGTDTVVYDIIRQFASAGTVQAAAGQYVSPYTGGCSGGTPSACGAVARSLPQCSGLVCSFVDDTAKSTVSYSIQNGNFSPNPTFWPGTAILTNSALVSNNELSVVGIAFNGMPTLYADNCSNYGINVSGGFTVCLGSKMSSNNAVPNQTATILTDGTNTGGGGIPGAKGRMIFETNGSGASNAHQIITLYDSNPQKTRATTGYRPQGDPGDMYLGYDSVGNLMIGGGTTGIAQYVNNIGDGANWLERLTSSLKTFKVPVQAPVLNAGNGFQVNGSYGSPGQCLISTGTGTTWGKCGETSSTSSTVATHEVPLQSRFAGRDANDGIEKKSGQLPSTAVAVVGPLSACEQDSTCQKSKSGLANGNVAVKNGSVSFLSPIAHGSCADSTSTVDGMAASASIIASSPANLSPGMIASVYVTRAGSVAVRLCNFSGTAVTPGVLPFSVTAVSFNLSGNESVAFPQLPNGSCAAKTFPLPGVSANDAVIPRWPGTLEPGLLGSMRASSDNTIEVQLCNLSGTAITPAPQNFGATIPK